MLTFVYAYIEVFEENDADVLLSECWTSMPQAFNANPCLAMSILYDMGYIVTCESDLHGAISQAILLSASRGGAKPLFGEFTARNPINKNSELLWHCGPFPLSAKKTAHRLNSLTQNRASRQKTAHTQLHVSRAKKEHTNSSAENSTPARALTRSVLICGLNSTTFQSLRKSLSTVRISTI
ncbi:MAG: hypothetical protein L6V93_17230 [Clostridiales bacterium]|nr:MAG: hypothetical protein L6V93_17230 [Clostridiales bacterium]